MVSTQITRGEIEMKEEWVRGERLTDSEGERGSGRVEGGAQMVLKEKARE